MYKMFKRFFCAPVLVATEVRCFLNPRRVLAATPGRHRINVGTGPRPARCKTACTPNVLLKHVRLTPWICANAVSFWNSCSLLQLWNLTSLHSWSLQEGKKKKNTQGEKLSMRHKYGRWFTLYSSNIIGRTTSPIPASHNTSPRM